MKKRVQSIHMSTKEESNLRAVTVLATETLAAL